MATDSRSFARALDRAAARLIDDSVRRTKQQLAINALTRLVERTPAASGHARANWQVTIGAPASGVVAGADPSGAQTLAQGAAAILGDRDPFATVWLTNNVPYIQRLEHGDSSRPPDAMVARTLADLSNSK